MAPAPATARRPSTSVAAAAFVAAPLATGGGAAPRRCTADVRRAAWGSGGGSGGGGGGGALSRPARRLCLRARPAGWLPVPLRRSRSGASRLPAPPVAAAASPESDAVGGRTPSSAGTEGGGGVGGATWATTTGTSAAAAASADAATAGSAATAGAPPATSVAARLESPAAVAEAAPAQLPAGTPFDYTNQWYPIFYVRDLDATVVTPFWLLGHPLVVWWAGGGDGPGAASGGGAAGECGWSVLADVCPHRGAPLSEGRVAPAEGEKPAAIVCGYHGWEFNRCGGCVQIPQRPPTPSGRIPPTASVSRAYASRVVAGRLWVFGGDVATAATAPPPYIPYDFQHREAVSFRDVVRILPYDPTTLVENVIDPAHVQVAHHGTDQGRRTAAVPIKFRMVPVDAETMDGGPEGWASTHTDVPGEGKYVPLDTDAERVWAESVGIVAGQGNGRAAAMAAADPSGAFAAHYYSSTAPMPPMSRLTFRPPFTVVYQVRAVPPSPAGAGGVPPKVRSLCLWMTGVPSRPGETRLVIAMAVPPLTGWKGLLFRLRPAVLSHQAVNVVLDGDNSMLAGQEQRVAAAGGWRAAYHLVAGEADDLVLRYRRWLDREGGAIPWAPSPAGAGVGVAETAVGLGGRALSPSEAAVDRYSSHVRHCVICRTALACLFAARVVVAVLAVIAAGVTAAGVAAPAAVPPVMAAVSAVVAAVGVWGVAALGAAVRRFGATDVAKRLAHSA